MNLSRVRVYCGAEDGLLPALPAYPPPRTGKWLDPEETRPRAQP